MIRLTQKPSNENIDICKVDFSRTYDHATALIGEEFSYQVVLCGETDQVEWYTLRTCSALETSIYRVCSEAVSWPHYQNADPVNCIINEPGIVGDCLVPVKTGSTLAVGPIPVVLWVSVRGARSGMFESRLCFTSAEDAVESVFELNVIQCAAPKEILRHCEYIFPSSISEAHHIPLFCNEYWAMLDKYFKLAADHGVTDVLVPAFPTVCPSISIQDPVQLIQIHCEGSDYRFNFDLMDTWMHYAFRNGIKNMVFPPLFISLAGNECLPWKQIKYNYDMPLFDEELSCLDDKYLLFVKKLLRKMNEHFRELDFGFTYTFQLTDGFKNDFTESYLKIRNAISKVIGNARILDPVSDRRLFDENFFGSTVIALDKIDDFSDASLIHSFIQIDPKNTSPCVDLFTATRSEYLCSLSTICFKNHLTAFYNRGFNFKDSQCMYPTGALSLIYPEPGGPVPSVRLKQLRCIQQDVQAFHLLRSRTSFEKVMTLIRRHKNSLELREAVHRLLSDKNQK